MTENFLQVFKKYSVSESHSIADYVRHSKQSIYDAQLNFENRISEIATGEDWASAIEDTTEESEKFHHIFPNFFRMSSFIGLYSYFENRISRLCGFIQERKSYRLRLSDLSGENIIERSKRYLTLVVGLDLSSLNPEWVMISDHQKIRNCFVHNGSDIWLDKNSKLEQQRLYPIISKYPLLELTPFGIVFIIDDQFLLGFIDLQIRYLSKLIDIADPVFRSS